MRKSVKDPEYRCFTYQSSARVPDLEFGYWPQTIRRWLREGLHLELTKAEQNLYSSPKLDEYFGFDERFIVGVPFNEQMNPPFEYKLLEHKSDGSEIVRNESGIISRQFPLDADDSSVPQFIDFPVKTPSDWQVIKERYRPDDPARTPTPEIIRHIRREQAEGKMGYLINIGFYALLRNLMGTENLSYAFYDFPDMLHDIVDNWAELLVRQIEKFPPDIVIDYVMWWEDLACKNGPLLSPGSFSEFLKPGYRRVMTVLKKRGCCLGIVDCDGNPQEIVQDWLDEGVNVMFPLEATIGVDLYEWREKWGKYLRLKGGIAKESLVKGGAAIDKELERIKPLIEQEGYIPHIDHLVPPDVPFKHYMQYLDKKRKMIGK